MSGSADGEREEGDNWDTDPGRDDEAAAEEAIGDMDSELRDMEARGEQLEDEVEQTRGDWRRKQSDESVPGAEPED